MVSIFNIDVDFRLAVRSASGVRAARGIGFRVEKAAQRNL